MIKNPWSPVSKKMLKKIIECGGIGSVNKSLHDNTNIKDRTINKTMSKHGVCSSQSSSISSGVEQYLDD